MSAEPELVKLRRPIWGIISVCIPFITVPAAIWVLHLPQPESAETGTLRLFQFADLLLLTPLLSCVAAVISLLRREKYRRLALAGIFLSFCPLIYLVFFRHG